jgi:hydrogenase nickel incorporation protein HypA/HybF
MHEMSVAQNVFNVISDEASKQGAKPTGAKISYGRLYAINDELLHFAFDAITKGTSYEGMKLYIEHKPLIAHCNKCNTEYKIEISDWKCPKCKSEDYKILPDAPLILEEIDFQTE